MPNIIDQSQLCLRTVQNQMAPIEGPKALPVSLDFSALPDYTLDYSSQQAQGFFSLLQSVYVDNGQNGSNITITINATGQRIIVPANSQAYLPVLCQNPITLSFASAGNVIVPVYLLNFPVAPAVWSV